jgi:hypothetical protein
MNVNALHIHANYFCFYHLLMNLIKLMKCLIIQRIKVILKINHN